MSHDLDLLLEKAKGARQNAHAPYSKYLVGSAIRLKTGEIFAGCNVENASYGGTVCAERVAIFNAVSAKGKIEISEVLVVTDQAEPWPPCGFCRQVISEFSNDNTRIHLANLQGIQLTKSFLEIFPSGFSPKHLK